MPIIRPEAEADIRAARDWYEATAPGLGVAFIAELDDLFHRLEANPRLYAEFVPSVRRALTRRFPYAVYYTPRDTNLIVLAVLHQRRNPEHWRSRLPLST